MLELAPTDDYAHYALGRCLEKKGHEHEANGHYKLASSLRPGSEQYAARRMRLSLRRERNGPRPNERLPETGEHIVAAATVCRPRGDPGDCPRPRADPAGRVSNGYERSGTDENGSIGK